MRFSSLDCSLPPLQPRSAPRHALPSPRTVSCEFHSTSPSAPAAYLSGPAPSADHAVPYLLTVHRPKLRRAHPVPPSLRLRHASWLSETDIEAFLAAGAIAGRGHGYPRATLTSGRNSGRDARECRPRQAHR